MQQQSEDTMMEIKSLSGEVLLSLNANSLSGANLSEANLRGADLSEANLRGADLSEADLCWARGIIDAGEDPRGYRFIAVRQKKGYMIHAGCRWFTPEEAVSHWAERHENGLREEILGKLELISAVAKAREWV